MLLSAVLGATCALASPEAIKNTQAPEAGKAAVFSFGGEKNREFMLDGKPFQIRSGEIHPQRVPRQYWQQRIQAAKAMGLNTIAFYVFWNTLEQPDGSWDFSGSNDIAAFIDLCQKEGMWVLFRPGPFVCGEWDLGGLPTYLIKADESKLRYTGNKEFMDAQTRYLDQMAKIAIPRLCKNGGPILMVQLENEYGSYKTDHDEMAYIEWLKDYWEKKGAENFYLSEGSQPHHLRFVPKGVAIGLDPGENDGAFNRAWSVSPEVPVFSSETYPGWLRHWGEGNWTPARGVLNSVKWFMEKGHSFNLFVLHGGTSFGLTAGANTGPKGGAFQADLTSYDYGSPIGEHGNLTKEYFEYRDIIQGYMPETKLPEVPAVPECMEVAEFTPKNRTSLRQLTWKTEAKQLDTPCTIESLGQNQGMARYKATLPAGPEAKLHCKAHDFSIVVVDGKPIGTLDRQKAQEEITIPAREKEATLEVFVDTFGHVNFSAFLEKDRKGIIGQVTLDGKPVTGWSVALLPLEHCKGKFETKDKAPAEDLPGGLFKDSFTLDKVADTFIDMKDWGKGYVWVNGHLLGRYWHIGPQERLYCPANFLKKGKNSIVILDTLVDSARPVRGCTERNMEVHKQTKALNNQW